LEERRGAERVERIKRRGKSKGEMVRMEIEMNMKYTRKAYGK
jgi:hypothetical protein